MGKSSLLQEVLEFLGQPQFHSTETDEYRKLDERWIKDLRTRFTKDNQYALSLFGVSCIFPYIQQGAVDSANLLGLFELMLFKWYSTISRHRFDCVAVDIGSNIGFHSLYMAKSFRGVRSFDPDIKHYNTFVKIMTDNGVADKVIFSNVAVTDKHGEVTFTRVLDNPTASYVENLKSGYGPLEYLKIPCVSGKSAIENSLICKIDAEGAESRILSSISSEQWSRGLFCFFEISCSENRQPIFDCLRMHGISIYCQSTGWKAASSYLDLPCTWRDGNCVAFKPSIETEFIYSQFIGRC